MKHIKRKDGFDQGAAVRNCSQVLIDIQKSIRAGTVWCNAWQLSFDFRTPMISECMKFVSLRLNDEVPGTCKKWCGIIQRVSSETFSIGSL